MAPNGSEKMWRVYIEVGWPSMICSDLRWARMCQSYVLLLQNVFADVLQRNLFELTFSQMAKLSLDELKYIFL